MITALGPRLGLGLRLDFGSQVWFVQYFSEKKVIVSPDRHCRSAKVDQKSKSGLAAAA